MKITQINYYDGAKQKVCRLGLASLFLDLQQLLLNTKVYLLEQKDANGAAVIREEIDNGFSQSSGWIKTASGGVDWVKKIRYNDTIIARIGVEVQVSARSDMLIRDIVHLRNEIQADGIDVGVIVVPSDALQNYLPDRTPSFKDAVRYIEHEFKEAMTFPIIVIAIEHDGAGEAIKKKKKFDPTQK